MLFITFDILGHPNGPPHRLRNPALSLRNPNRFHSFFYFYITYEAEIQYATLIHKNNMAQGVLNTLVCLVGLDFFYSNPSKPSLPFKIRF